MQDQERILAEHRDGLERNDFCDFDKLRKCAYQKGRLSPTSKAKREASRNEFMEKSGMLESKAFKKLIVERII